MESRDVTAVERVTSAVTSRSVARDEPRDVTLDVTGRDGLPFDMPDVWPLPAEARDAVRMAGLADPEGAWSKFCGHHIGRDPRERHDRRGWLALFTRKWAVDERRREAVERGRAGPRGARAVQPPAAEGEQCWEARDVQYGVGE